MPPDRSAPVPRLWLWAGLEALLAFVLSMIHIGSRSLWYDEGFSAVISGSSWGEIARVANRTDPNMTAYSAAVHLWRIPFGSSEAALRSLSAVGVAAAVIVLVALARRLHDDRTALVAGLFLAVAPHAQRYAQEARSYGLLVLAVVSATYCFVRVLDDRSTAWAVTYGVVTASACYLHLFALWVIGVHAVALLLLPAALLPRRALLVGAGTLVVLLLPLAGWVHGADTNLDWIVRPGVDDLFHVSSEIAGGNVVTIGLGLLVVVALVTFGRGVPRRHRSRALFADGLGLIWLFLPFVCTFVISLVFEPMFLGRYLIVCVPALALVAATALVRLRWPVVAAGVAAVVVLASVVAVVREYDDPITDWRGAVEYVAARSAASDGVVVCAAVHRPPVDYYVERLLPPRARPRALSPRGSWGSGVHDDGVSNAVAATWADGGPERIWVIGNEDACGFGFDSRTRAVARAFVGTNVARYDRG